MAQLRSTCLVTLFLSSVLIGACAFHISPSTRGPTWSFPHRTSPTALSSSSSSNPATALPPGSSVFLLGVGFTQFLAARSLIDAGLKPVLMSDVAKAEGIRTNWVPSPTATIVTNGEGEWESTASSCSALVVCPEAADIPGSTVTALLSRMDRCERIVVVSPAGTVTGEPIKNEEENWLLNRMKILGGKRVGAAADDMSKALSVEAALTSAVASGRVQKGVIIHRGVLKGGGGPSGLGDAYYKVCGSEPEEIVERTYDNARKGLTVLPGDGIYVGEKVKEKGDGPDVVLRNLKEELKDKTSRLSLSTAIAAAVLLPEPPERVSVLCGLSEEDVALEEVARTVEGCASKV